MRTAIFACILLAFALAAFGQHSKTGPIGGKPATSGKSKPKPRPKPKRDIFTEPWDTPCGVHYEGGLDELAKDVQVEWRLASETDDSEWYWNTQKTTCNRQTHMLETWLKHVIKNPTSETAFTTARYDMDCSSARTRLVYLAIYNSKGEAINSGALEREWQETLPDSAMDGVVKAVCHKAL
jgi:hypothetical protein